MRYTREGWPPKSATNEDIKADGSIEAFRKLAMSLSPQLMVASSMDPEWSFPQVYGPGIAASTPGTLWDATYEIAGAKFSVLARDRCRHHEPLPSVHCLCRASEEASHACQPPMDAARKAME